MFRIAMLKSRESKFIVKELEILSCEYILDKLKCKLEDCSCRLFLKEDAHDENVIHYIYIYI